MATIQSTVIMKTDLRGYTPRVKTLSEAELSVLLDRHKTFISTLAAKNGGLLVKGEGDSFWITFPSVGAAANAAADMQQELRLEEIGKNDEERLAIRIVIGLGDVLHQGGDIFGDIVNLVARIETITPSDEIYLSQAAWLALNKVEVPTSLVNEFVLKGINEPVLVYKIERIQKTRLLKNRTIVFVDLSGIANFWNSHPLEDSENLVIRLDEMIKNICAKEGGLLHFIMGDSYFLTFPEVKLALAGITDLAQQWAEFMQRNQISCSLYIGIHKGDVNILRSHVFGDDVTVAASLAYQRLVLAEPRKTIVLATSRIVNDMKDTEWEKSFKKVDGFEEETFHLKTDSDIFSNPVS